MNNNQQKLYATKAEISQIFGVKLKTLGTDLTKMRRDPNFSQYILDISHKRVFVSIVGYEAFLMAQSVKHHEAMRKAWMMKRKLLAVLGGDESYHVRTPLTLSPPMRLAPKRRASLLVRKPPSVNQGGVNGHTQINSVYSLKLKPDQRLKSTTICQSTGNKQKLSESN